ncbi:unnamed protein product [Trichogramma brassicae]|uniref:Anoctamin n=1 Tax=Trichogramma brassicae TaxID=86971 RepID=A0A6H5I1U6_9HYME|nr:unnamed protein product [Trichogramma brassicae]
MSNNTAEVDRSFDTVCSSNVPSVYFSAGGAGSCRNSVNESHYDNAEDVSFVIDELATIDKKIREGVTENVMTGSCESLGKRINNGLSIFEANLAAEGLELEYDDDDDDDDEDVDNNRQHQQQRRRRNGLRFFKITAPREVLRRYSEILKLRMPMRDVPGNRGGRPSTSSSINKGQLLLRDVNRRVRRRCLGRFEVNPVIFPPLEHRFTAVYSRDKEYLFDTEAGDFFTPAIRSRIVQFILDRTRFVGPGTEDDFAFGIERLIKVEKAYSAAYPLHDGTLKTQDSMRYLLYTEWASIKKCFHYQPLDYIKEYFGVKIGLYFAWLGFYTHMLLSASVVGLMCFAYSLITLNSDEISNDVCTSNITMCALCDHFCSTWNLKDTCFHSKVTYLFDNPATVFFAVFMSLWATLFLELWKNYSAEITHRWDLTSLDVHEEHPRPKYLARLAHVKKKSVNFVTNTVEPRVPFWRVRLPVTILSCSVVLLLIAVAMAAVLGVVLYRMSVLTALYGLSRNDDNGDEGDGSSNNVVTSYAILLTTVTAAGINLCCIVVFNWIYVWLAECLTEIELQRTQTEFDDSLTLKIYLLEFVNYYASIFYIAFFKGKFIGHPGAYNRVFDSRQEECGPGGCLLELCIQLSIIMIGKQAMNSILEMCLPLFWKLMNTLRLVSRRGRGDALTSPSSSNSNSGSSGSKYMHLQWVRDYKLVEWGPRSLFPEYLEMVLQYGFVTIFVAAFPLAPFFALVNNVLEMRLDAKKLLTMYRRPVSQRVRDIGIWYRILDSVSKLSVITNGFIIAFTSNFIPRLVYRLAVAKDRSLGGYLDYSLSKFNTSDDSTMSMISSNSTSGGEICHYPDYREPPDSANRYQYTDLFWHILAARLAFVVVFENFLAVIIIIVRWCIPDMSAKLRDKIRREAYITNEIIIQHEARRAAITRSCLNVLDGADNSSLLAAVAAETNLLGSGDNPTTAAADRWDRVLKSSLSQSDFDLEVHGSPMINMTELMAKSSNNNNNNNDNEDV